MTEVVSMITNEMDATFPKLSEAAKPQEKKSKDIGGKPDQKKKALREAETQHLEPKKPLRDKKWTKVHLKP
ncbi:hypothetical protein Ddc_23729 [Ditylenchus destructor]|nr:hypothetical protein Ddc_23729 [Ditylenchus destructor]